MTDTPWTFLREDDFATKLTAARSVPTFSWPADGIALWHLGNRTLLVDTAAGVIVRPNGNRAERLQLDGYGTVYLGRFSGKIRVARAHRIIWIAAHGPIPGSYVINHRNSLRWDNRLANLDLTTRSGNVRHANQQEYEHVAGVPFPRRKDDRPEFSPYASSVLVHGRSRNRASRAF